MRSVIKLENTFIFIITIAVYVNRKTGSYVYNIGHTYITPIIIALLYLYIDERLLLQISLIWLAHISIDRTLGFGLKYSSDTDKTIIQKM